MAKANNNTVSSSNSPENTAAKSENSGGSVYLLNNDSYRVITIEGVRLMVGVNKLTKNQVEKIKKSKYFDSYFHDDEKKDRLEWVSGFSPEDKGKDIFDLPLSKAKSVIKEIYDIDFLNQLEVECKNADLLAVIKKQQKEVLPSEKELK